MFYHTKAYHSIPYAKKNLHHLESFWKIIADGPNYKTYIKFTIIIGELDVEPIGQQPSVHKHRTVASPLAGADLRLPCHRRVRAG